MTTEPSAVSTIATAFFGLAFVIVFFAVRKPEERNFLLPLGLAAFTLKAVLIPIYYLVLVNADLEGFAYFDTIKYHYRGIEVAEEFKYGVNYSSQAWRTVDPGFSLLSGLVYWIVGINTLAVRLLNAVFTTVMLLYVYRIGRLVSEDAKVARWACYLTAFLPFSITIAIDHRKDPLVALIATFIFYHAMRLLRFDKNWAGSAVLIVAGLAAMSFFRSGFVPAFIGILFICYLLTQRSPLQAIALSIPTILLLVVAQAFVPEDASISFAASAERLQGKLYLSAGQSGVGGLTRYVHMNSIFEIYKLPVATLLVAIFPFPPYVSGSLPGIITSWANLPNLIFLPHMVAGAWLMVRQTDWRKSIPVVIFPAIYLVLIGATHVGTPRYRETVFPMMMVLAGTGLVRGRNLILSIFVYVGLIALGAVALFFRYR